MLPPSLADVPVPAAVAADVAAPAGYAAAGLLYAAEAGKGGGGEFVTREVVSYSQPFKSDAT